ncbi:MAG: hypothetical protein JO002_11800, partial [Burkholderiaceae bacterium]|nr:hypothetical protein [Burkholderiaceae bacterium]
MRNLLDTALCSIRPLSGFQMRQIGSYETPKQLPQPRAVATLASLVGTAVLLAACGGGSVATVSPASAGANAQNSAAQSAGAAQEGVTLDNVPAPDLPVAEAKTETPASSSGANTALPVMVTSALLYPASGNGMVPLLPASQEPLETTQFTLADGTLVTRYGLVGRGRHARERGEDWNEIGYGPNDTVNAAGQPVDKGPGHYLIFVENYFKNRTWGVEIIDNSRVAGVTKPTLRINNYFQEAQRAGGRAFFHRFDSPNVTGYGWMTPGQLVDNSLYGVDYANCPVVPRPPNGKLLHPDTVLNDGCSATVAEYPGHAALSPDANGVLVPSSTVPGATAFYDYAVNNGVTGTRVSGTDIHARPLKIGDAVEVTQAFFSTPQAMLAVGDTGNDHYYTTELTYVVGTGLRPWYGITPRLNNAALPDAALQGGTGSTPYDYANNSAFVFQQEMSNIGMEDLQRFVEGRRILHTNMTTGLHNEPGNDPDTALMNLQGASFNQSSCFACHVNNGAGSAPATVSQKLDNMAVHTAMLDANGKQLPDPHYGVTVQMNGNAPKGGLMDLGHSVTVGGFDTQTVKLADGTPVELRKPVLAFAGPVPQVTSLRAARPIIGMGLLEAIPETEILAGVRSTPDA